MDPSDAPPAPPGLPKWTAMRLVGLGTFMSALDNSVMNVANPTLQRAFHEPIDTVQWVSTAYLITVSALLLACGRLSDLTGRRLPYTLGFAVFTAGSALCGLAVSIPQLVAFRILQGIGAALLFATGPAILLEAFPAGERGKALGIVGSIVGVGVLTGPPVGGLVCQYLGWRWVFFLNLPIGLLGSVRAWRVLRAGRPGTGSRADFDLPGAVCLVLSVGLLLVGLDLAVAEIKALRPLTATPVLATLLPGLALLAAFLGLEARAPQPIFDLGLFRNRDFTLAAIGTFLSYVAVFAALFLTPNFLRTLAEQKEARIGLLLALMPLVMGTVTPLSGLLSDRIGSRLLSSVGMAIIIGVLVALACFDRDTRSWPFGVALAALGLGHALFQAPNSSTLFAAVPRERLGVAAGTLATMRNLGMAIGIFLPVAVFVAVFNRHLPGVNPTLPAGGGAHPEEFVAAWRTAFLVTAAACAPAVLTSVWSGGRAARAGAGAEGVDGADLPSPLPSPAAAGEGERAGAGPAIAAAGAGERAGADPTSAAAGERADAGVVGGTAAPPERTA